MNLRSSLSALPLVTILACDQNSKMPTPELSEGTKAIRVVESTEVTPNSISFGNVTFRISEQSQVLSPKQQKLLFENLKKAYQVLVTYFSETLMTTPEAMDIPIRVKLTKGNGSSEIVWKNYADTKDPCNIVKIEAYELVLQTFSIDVLAHELFHLFQLHGSLESKMFTEGQAHALMALLFENPASWAANQDRIDEMNIPMHEAVLSKPWDYAYCQNVMPEDSSTQTMEMLIRTKYATLWLEFIKENPNFLNEFYKAIAELRGKRDRASFTHEDLVKIAASVSPNFMTWYQVHLVLHPIKERKTEEKVLLWTPLGERRLGLFNFEVEIVADRVVKVRQATPTNQTATFTANLIIGGIFTGNFPASGLYQSVNIDRPFVAGPAVTASRLAIGDQLITKID